MNLRGAKPVVDNSVRDFIESLNPSKDLYNENIQQEFIENFYNWITSSKLNNIQGLDDFPNRKLVAGTAQAFDHFYWRHKDRRFRFFEGEFMYHSAVLKHGGMWEYITEEVPVMPGDAVIISVPFSDYGTVHSELETILEMCETSGVPVLLDFAYYPCTKNIELDLDKYFCVTTVTFSISKAFYGAEFLRVGMRLERFDTDDGIDVFNSVEMVNRVSLSIASKLINKYDVDYNWLTYEDVYNQVCKEKDLKTTDCIMFGLGGEEYAEYNRGTDVNRVCISELIGEKINDSSK
jgi:hypothetical protein